MHTWGGAQNVVVMLHRVDEVIYILAPVPTCQVCHMLPENPCHIISVFKQCFQDLSAVPDAAHSEVTMSKGCEFAPQPLTKHPAHAALAPRHTLN